MRVDQAAVFEGAEDAYDAHVRAQKPLLNNGRGQEKRGCDMGKRSISIRLEVPVFN